MKKEKFMIFSMSPTIVIETYFAYFSKSSNLPFICIYISKFLFMKFNFLNYFESETSADKSFTIFRRFFHSILHFTF